MSTKDFAGSIDDSHKIHVDFFIRTNDIKGAEDGQKVLIKLKEWKSDEQNPTGVVLEILGFPGEHKTEMNAIIAEYGLPEHFPDAVEYEAKKIPTEIITLSACPASFTTPRQSHLNPMLSMPSPAKPDWHSHCPPSVSLAVK